jgi:hypothetical protein
VILTYAAIMVKGKQGAKVFRRFRFFPIFAIYIRTFLLFFHLSFSALKSTFDLESVAFFGNSKLQIYPEISAFGSSHAMLLYAHQDCLDTPAKAAAFWRNLGGSQKLVYLNKPQNPGLLWRRDQLDKTRFARKVSPSNFDKRGRTFSNGVTYNKKFIDGIKAVERCSMAKAKKMAAAMLERPVNQTEFVQALYKYLTPRDVNEILGRYACAHEASVLSRSVNENSVDVLCMQWPNSLCVLEETGMRVTREWADQVTAHYMSTAQNEIQSLEAALEAQEQGVHDQAVVDAFEACQSLEIHVKKSKWNVETRQYDYDTATKTFGTEIKTAEDLLRFFGCKIETYYGEDAVSNIRRKANACILGGEDSKELRQAAYNAVCNFIQAPRQRRHIRKQLNSARLQLAHYTTQLKCIEEFHALPESVDPLTDTKAFERLGDMALMKKIIYNEASVWRCPPGALSRFKEAIIAADEVFLRNRRASGLLTDDPFFIELCCEDQRCDINGDVVSVPNCKIRVHKKTEVVIDFVGVDNVYRSLHGKDTVLRAVRVFADGSAIFHGQEGLVFQELLRHWNDDAELTVNKLLGVSKGRCVFCHKVLSVNSSKEQGYGDVCKKKFQESIFALRGKIEHTVNKDAEVVTGVDVQPAKRLRVPVVTWNGHAIPKTIIDKSEMLQAMAEDFDIGEHIQGLLGVDAELLEIMAYWLDHDQAFFPVRAHEILPLCDKLAIPYQKLIDYCYPCVNALPL